MDTVTHYHYPDSNVFFIFFVILCGNRTCETLCSLFSGEQGSVLWCRKAVSGGWFYWKLIHVEFKLFGKTAVHQQAGVFRERGRVGLAEFGTVSMGSVLAEFLWEDMCACVPLRVYCRTQKASHTHLHMILPFEPTGFVSKGICRFHQFLGSTVFNATWNFSESWQNQLVSENSDLHSQEKCPLIYKITVRLWNKKKTSN